MSEVTTLYRIHWALSDNISCNGTTKWIAWSEPGATVGTIRDALREVLDRRHIKWWVEAPREARDG